MKDQIAHYEAKLAYETDSSDLYAALQEGQNWVVIDTRRSEFYEQEHIAGAINLPHREMNEDTLSKLDKTTLYVCYCDGIGCNASTKGALKMATYGLRVKELIGGLQWWKFDGYPVVNGEKVSEDTGIHCAC